jgi:hypothetical protein
MNGYDLHEIRRLAHAAALSSRFMMRAGDMSFRVDLAWSGIAEALLQSDELLNPSQLVAAGMSEISREIYHLRRNTGHDPSGRLEFAPKFWAYWESLPRGGPETAVVDRVALQQIWRTLRSDYKAVLEAVSVHDSHSAAARSIGLTDTQLTNKLRLARAEFFALWHEGEKPSAVWRKTLRGKRRTTCTRGHELIGDNIQWRGKPGNRTRTCKTCSNASKARYRERMRTTSEGGRS